MEAMNHLSQDFASSEYSTASASAIAGDSPFSASTAAVAAVAAAAEAMAPSKQQVFLSKAVADFSVLKASEPSKLIAASDALVAAFRQHAHREGLTMSPSYTHVMPDGSESGTSVAVDLGGSTLRAAVVRLYSRARRSISVAGPRPGTPTAAASNTASSSANITSSPITSNPNFPPADIVHRSFADVRCRKSWLVDDRIKRLSGVEFFDWIAERIAQVVEAAGEADGRNLSLGLTWSFPIEQTGLASGNVQQMGKGYEMWAELAGTDLKSHFDAAFSRRGLRLRMTALMNDTEATLLSHAHTNPSTRLSLIWGTGLNAAIQLPVSAVGAIKFGERPKEWSEAATAVLLNTEISIFGAGVLPLTAADRSLDAASNAPGFQPLEQCTSGRYLGEIVRYTLVEGVRQGALFDGRMPGGMDTQWAFGTDVMSDLEKSTPAQAGALLSKRFTFPLEPTIDDVYTVQRICLAVSERAALLVATTLFSLWRLQRDAFKADDNAKDAVLESRSSVAISYCGAVAEKHCTARVRCQEILDTLIENEPLAGAGAGGAGTSGGVSGGAGGEHLRRRLILEQADDSGLLGAAVAAVMNKPDATHTRNRSISRL